VRPLTACGGGKAWIERPDDTYASSRLRVAQCVADTGLSIHPDASMVRPSPRLHAWWVLLYNRTRQYGRYLYVGVARSFAGELFASTPCDFSLNLAQSRTELFIRRCRTRNIGVYRDITVVDATDRSVVMHSHDTAASFPNSSSLNERYSRFDSVAVWSVSSSVRDTNIGHSVFVLVLWSACRLSWLACVCHAAV